MSIDFPDLPISSISNGLDLPKNAVESADTFSTLLDDKRENVSVNKDDDAFLDRSGDETQTESTGKPTKKYLHTSPPNKLVKKRVSSDELKENRDRKSSLILIERRRRKARRAQKSGAGTVRKGRNIYRPL